MKVKIKRKNLANKVSEVSQERNKRGGNRRGHLVNSADEAMNYLQYETARELGLTQRIKDIGYENMTTKECGAIGGLMTKKMVAYAQQKMQEEVEEKGDLYDLPIFDPEEEHWDFKDYVKTPSRVSPETEDFVRQYQAYEGKQRLH